MNAVCSDFISKFTRAIDFAPSNGRVRVKANSEPWFGSKIISAIQKKDQLYSRYKRCGLKTEKIKLKPQKYFFKRCYT